MIKIQANPENLLKRGVYKIVNITTGKYYVGSTIMTFIKRFQHHISMLRANRHKNAYLQNAWNKYGEDDFECFIIEVCEKNNCLEREQYWLDILECSNKEKSYNINPLATNITSREVIEKRRQTMLRKYASGEFDNIKEILRNHIPWNKGKKYISTDHLKVPKTITQKVKDKLKKHSEDLRNTSPEIFVYSLNKQFLGKWRCSMDLQEWSLTSNNNLPVRSRFSTERMGKPIKLLQSVNINKSCKTGKPYKGLIFSYKPLHQEIGVAKLDKNGEI